MQGAKDLQHNQYRELGKWLQVSARGEGLAESEQRREKAPAWALRLGSGRAAAATSAGVEKAQEI